MAGPLPMGPAQSRDVCPSSSGPTTHRTSQRGLVQCGLGSRQRGGAWRSGSRLLKLTIRSWNFTSLAGKGPVLVWKAERYRLDIAELTLTHSTGSGTSLLKSCLTPFYAGVAPSERRRAGVGLPKAPQLSAYMLGFTLVD